MDLDDLTAVLGQTGADVWDLIDGAINLAVRDHGKELAVRRMGIIEKLVLATATTAAAPREEEGRRSGAAERGTVRNNGRFVEDKETAGGGAREWKSRGSPSTPQSMHREDEDDEEEEGEEREHEEDIDADEDYEKTRILAIREHIEDPDEDEDTLITLLQNLLDMYISFISLRDTDIGRSVNNLRKHPSAEVRRVVKLLVKKWKDIVADWAKFNMETGSSAAASIITDGDSPQQIPAKSSSMNGYHLSDPGYSPNPHCISKAADCCLYTILQMGCPAPRNLAGNRSLQDKRPHQSQEENCRLLPDHPFPKHHQIIQQKPRNRKIASWSQKGWRLPGKGSMTTTRRFRMLRSKEQPKPWTSTTYQGRKIPSSPEASSRGSTGDINCWQEVEAVLKKNCCSQAWIPSTSYQYTVLLLIYSGNETQQLNHRMGWVCNIPYFCPSRN